MNNFKERLKNAWRALFPVEQMSEKRQKKYFEKLAMDAFMKKNLVEHIVAFFVNDVSYNMYTVATSDEPMDEKYYHEIVSQTVMIDTSNKSYMGDLIKGQIKDAVALGYVEDEGADHIAAMNGVMMIDLTESGKAYVIVELKNAMIKHYNDVIDKIRGEDEEELILR